MRPTKQAPTWRIPLLGLLVLLLIWPSMSLAGKPVPRAKQKAQLQQKKATLETRIRKVRSQIRVVKVQERQTRVKIRNVQSRLRVSRGQLYDVTLRLARSKHELSEATRSLRQAQRQFSSAQTQTKERLVALYERGEPGYLDLLLSAEDFGQMLQRAQLASYLMERDRDALSDLKTHREKVAEYQQHVQEKTREVGALQRQAALLNTRIEIEHIKVSKNLRVIKDKRHDMEAELAALERDSREVTSMILRLQATAAGRRRYRTVYAGPVGGLPVAGRITSGFGPRYHPVLHYVRVHTGVDIAAPAGTPIYAAGGGEVISAGWRGGYGNAVIIDHGGGKATLYGHMSSIAVRAGQTVSRRQMIGRVGSTGVSTGPHCHYEVRINGRPVNPL